MHLRVLGPLQLVGAGGLYLNLSSQEQRRLTSLLVSRANTAVSADLLQDSLGLSSGALRTSVSRLRKVIGADILVTVAPGYLLRTDQVDVQHFERLLAQAASGDDETARASLDEALALWRGDPYVEFAYEEWAVAEVVRLTELRLGAIEDLAELLVEGEDQAAAVTLLEPLVGAHPFRDRSRALLMRALAQSGRRIDALREFQAYRTLLIEEIGTEPPPFLVSLDRAIAVHGDGDLDARAPLPEHRVWHRSRRPAPARRL